MAQISNELCNPSPWPVGINWHAGIVITVPADGTVDLTVEQMDDFRGGKAGSEEVQNLMNHHGIFLRDPTKSYEEQSLEALKASVRSKQSLYNDHIQNLRRMRASQGISDNEEAFEEMVQQSGYSQLNDQVSQLKERIKFLEKLVDENPTHLRDSLDPERTLLFTDPPKVFPTKTSLQMFLNDKKNAEYRQMYEKQMEAYNTQPEDAA